MGAIVARMAAVVVLGGTGKVVGPGLCCAPTPTGASPPGPTLETMMPKTDVTDLSSASFATFQAQALAQGYDEALERVWAPASTAALHTHPFKARAVMVAGEMWLTVGDATRHLRVGDGFELDAQVPHSERYGDAGATYWVARKAVAAGA
jgi:hypothetical protein